MATTMNLIAKQTVGSGGAASVTFSNIPQTFTDLKIVVAARSNRSSSTFDSIVITFNNNTSNYSRREIYNEGGTVGSETQSDRIVGQVNASSSTSNTFGSFETYIPNYRVSQYKSYSTDIVAENNSSDVRQWLTASLWSDNTAISTITLTPNTGTAFDEYSTFYLYGISNSTTTQATTVPYASGGDVITTDGSYWYHTFLYSGTFTPLKALTCDYLVVAGGGGGNNYSGGGAGGVTTGTLSALAQSYTATIGAGGTGGNSNTDGGDSVFATFTSNKGLKAPSAYVGGTSGNGYTGGTGGNLGNPWVGGGGGGSSANGNNRVGTTAGSGGAGTASSISGSSVTYGGGGGGGAEGSGSRGVGGSGGGGNGSGPVGSPAGSAGTPNRGGGGGGGDGGNSSNGFAGGSGIIVVRYAVA